MPKTLLLSLTAFLVLPSAASAATAAADIEKRHGTNFGSVTFKAASGETNDLTVTQANGRLLFHDRMQSVDARGDCDQVNAHTASCPVTEDIAKVKLGNHSDFAKVEGLVEVFGGTGVDFLLGSAGFDDLNGGRGQDELVGGGTGDELTGGIGSDLVKGGRGDDDLIDGEKDGEAVKDFYVGGPDTNSARSDRGDMVIYASRDNALEIDLASGRAPAGDDLAGIESAEGGGGDDLLRGNDRDNWLLGGGGSDRIRGGDGEDLAAGEHGADDLKGGNDDDVLNGDRGADTFKAGEGDDDLIADDAIGEAVECGTGEDFARSTGADTLEECEVANSDPFYFQVQPEITDHTATFQVACQRLGGCDGGLNLRGPRGEDFGGGTFSDLPDDPQTFSPVTVTLTDAAVEALAEGVVVQVLHSETGGYRAFMQTGG